MIDDLDPCAVSPEEVLLRGSCNSQKRSDLYFAWFNLMYNAGRSLDGMVWKGHLKGFRVSLTWIERRHWLL